LPDGAVAEPAGWVRPVADGALVRVRVGPGASRAGLAGFHGESLRIRVRARPVGGAANRELLQILGRLLGVRAADLSLESGGRGRDKRVRVRGISAETVRARLGPAQVRVGSVDPAGARG
jgi:hypothetical protein